MESADRTGQVWELHAHLDLDLALAARAGLIVGRSADGWRVVMLTGDSPGSAVNWSENTPYEDNGSMTRIA